MCAGSGGWGMRSSLGSRSHVGPWRGVRRATAIGRKGGIVSFGREGVGGEVGFV